MTQANTSIFFFDPSFVQDRCKPPKRWGFNRLFPFVGVLFFAVFPFLLTASSTALDHPGATRLGLLKPQYEVWSAQNSPNPAPVSTAYIGKPYDYGTTERVIISVTNTTKPAFNMQHIAKVVSQGGDEVAKGGGGTVDFVAGVQAKSFGKVIGESTVHVRPTINSIENGSLLPRNATGYLNKELHPQLLGKPAGYWQEYHMLEFGSKSPLRILKGGQGEYFLSPGHYKSIIPLNR